MGGLPLCRLGAGAPFARVGRGVVTGDGGISRDYCVALQQYRSERLRRSPLSYDDQCHLATVSAQRIVLRSARLRSALGGGCHHHCPGLGTTHIDPPQHGPLVRSTNEGRLDVRKAWRALLEKTLNLEGAQGARALVEPQRDTAATE